MKQIIKKLIEGATIITLLVVPAAVQAVEPSTNQESQHTIILEAQACIKDGLTTVAYKATSWAQSTAGENPAIEITYQHQAGNQVSGYEWTATAPFQKPSYGFDGNFQINAAATRVTVIATAKGKWGDGRSGGQMTDVTLYPATCATKLTPTPEPPTATATATATATSTATWTNTPTTTQTPSSTPTATSTKASTPMPPTATATPTKPIGTWTTTPTATPIIATPTRICMDVECTTSDPVVEEPDADVYLPFIANGNGSLVAIGEPQVIPTVPPTK